MAGRLDGGGQQVRRRTIATDRRRRARPGADRHGDLRSSGGDEGVRGLWSPAKPCRPGQRAGAPRQRRQCILARIPHRGRHARQCRALQPEQHPELRQLHGSRDRPGSYARLRRYRCALLRGCRRDPRRAAEHERSSSVCSRAGPRAGAHRRSVAATARRGAARRSAGCVHHSDHYCCECRGRDAGPGVGLLHGSVAAARRRSPSRGTKTARQEPVDGPRGQGADAGSRSVGGTRSGVRVPGDGSGPATRRGAGGTSPGPTLPSSPRPPSESPPGRRRPPAASGGESPPESRRQDGVTGFARTAAAGGPWPPVPGRRAPPLRPPGSPTRR